MVVLILRLLWPPGRGIAHQTLFVVLVSSLQLQSGLRWSRAAERKAGERTSVHVVCSGEHGPRPSLPSLGSVQSPPGAIIHAALRMDGKHGRSGRQHHHWLGRLHDALVQADGDESGREPGSQPEDWLPNRRRFYTPTYPVVDRRRPEHVELGMGRVQIPTVLLGNRSIVGRRRMDGINAAAPTSTNRRAHATHEAAIQ